MKIDKQLIIEALKKTILAGASTHLTILAFFAWKTGSLDMINIYNILDFELIMPSIGSGMNNFICSWIFITAIFGLMLVISSQKKKSK